MMAGVLLRRHCAGPKGDQHERRSEAANERAADHMSPVALLALVFGSFAPLILPIESSPIPVSLTLESVEPILDHQPT
jgi:hypothetical protein